MFKIAKSQPPWNVWYLKSCSYCAKVYCQCRHFGERPNTDEIAGMEDRAVRWMNAVADTIRMKVWVKLIIHFVEIPYKEYYPPI